MEQSNMIFKKINNYDNYIIYENGDIINTDSKNNISFSLQQKKYIIRLKKNTKTKTFNYLRLIYETFYNTKLSLNDIIKFKNSNTLNFHFTNLEKINRTDLRKVINHIELDNNKEWQIIKNYNNYKISNYGDIFSLKTNTILIPTENNGYLRIKLINNNIWILKLYLFLNKYNIQ
jgi:hypothetical protein